MKKDLIILAFLLAAAFRGVAQDTIAGVVNRVAAPFFEQNVCDTRFAITAEGETYYVMVDDYWPNPYLEDLVIHYDTIPVGNEIDVVGTIMEMEDGNGESFKTINISKNLSSIHQQILGFYYYNEISLMEPNPITAAYFYNRSGIGGFFITINGELQIQNPFIINGRILEEGLRYLFIGCRNTLTDYNGNAFDVFELVDALPYDKKDFSINGTLTTENDLCLLSPRGETHFLSLFDGVEHRYLTNKRIPITNYINDAVFMEGDSMMVSGFEFIRHDLFGTSFKTLEIINMQSLSEHMLIGVAGNAGIPYTNIGPPIPGVCLALYSEGVDYYIRQPQYDELFFYFDDYYVVGNDTIFVTDQQLTASCCPGIFINNYIEPEYTVRINQVEFLELGESFPPEIQLFPNPSNGTIKIATERSIKHISVCDCTGRIMLNQSCNSNQRILDLHNYKGLAIIQIIFENGQTASRKVVL